MSMSAALSDRRYDSFVETTAGNTARRVKLSDDSEVDLASGAEVSVAPKAGETFPVVSGRTTKIVRKALAASGTVLAAQANISYKIVSVEINAEADDLDVSVHYTDTPSDTNVFAEGKFKDGGGMVAPFGTEGPKGAAANQELYATLNSGTGTFNVVIAYQEV